MKKFNYNAQLFMTSAIVFLSLMYFIDDKILFFSALLLLLLGIWQLISALVQTNKQVFKVYKKQIRIYWTIAGTSLFLFSSSIFMLIERFNSDICMYTGVVSMFVGLTAAIYYLYMYKTCFLAIAHTDPGAINTPLV